MERKLVLALGLASALVAPMSAYAQSDEKETTKPELTQVILTQSDEKEAPKPELAA